MMKLRHAGLAMLCALALVACGKGEKAKDEAGEKDALRHTSCVMRHEENLIPDG